MRLLQCDICLSKVEREQDLYLLRDEYKSKLYEVDHLCPNCNRELNEMNNKLLAITTNVRKTWLQNFLGRLLKERQDV